MRKINSALIILLCMALAVLLALPARSVTAQETPEQTGQVVEKSEKMRQWEREQEKARNKNRHEDLKNDTDKLLQLATDLKAAVDKSNEQTLSMDVIRKAADVEKLARNIQKKMKAD